MAHLFDLAEKLRIRPFPVADADSAAPMRLKPETLAEEARSAGLSAEEAASLERAAQHFADHPELSAYFNWLSLQFFDGTLRRTPDLSLLPEAIGVLNEEELYAFFGLLALSGFDSCRRGFAAAHLPPEILAGALDDCRIWIQHFRKNLGLTGVSRRALGWLCGVLNGDPLTIGRMQYRIRPLRAGLQVYRHRHTGKVVAFAAAGGRFNRGGFVDGVDGEFDPVAWTADFTVTPTDITGHVITPTGHVEREITVLPATDYLCVFRDGDLTLDTHIPEGDPLTLDDCRESMTRALAFFRQDRPEEKIRGFSCLSWMLDPQYEFLLKPNSRILAFMRQYYLFPIAEGGADALWRIFGEDGLRDGIASAPRHTSMQRKVAEFIERGGKLRSGGGFLLPEELPRYGEAPYRD